MDDVIKEIEKWGAISVGVSGGVSLVALILAIYIAIQVNKFRLMFKDLSVHMKTLETEFKNMSAVTLKKSEELNATILRLESATQIMQSQLTTVARSEYNDELMNRPGILPTRVLPPVPPKRSNSYYKSNYY